MGAVGCNALPLAWTALAGLLGEAGPGPGGWGSRAVIPRQFAAGRKDSLSRIRIQGAFLVPDQALKAHKGEGWGGYR